MILYAELKNILNHEKSLSQEEGKQIKNTDDDIGEKSGQSSDEYIR